MLPSWLFSTHHLTAGGLLRAAGRGFFFCALLYPLALFLGNFWGDWWSGILIAGVIGVAICQIEILPIWRGTFNRVRIARNDGILCLMLTIGMGAWIFYLYDLSWMPPGHDDLLVPMISRLMEQVGNPVTGLGNDEPGHLYPPGMPAALGLLTFSANPVTRLMTWIALSFDALACAPVLWALALRGWFGLKRPLWHITLANMVALIMVVRDPVLGAWLKNAQLVTFSTLLPATLWLASSWRRYRWGGLAMAPFMAGLGLYYFTTAYVMAAWIGGSFAVCILFDRVRWRQHLWWFGGALCAWVVMVMIVRIYLGAIPDDPRMTARWADIPWGVARLQAAIPSILANKEKFWFIMGAWQPLFVATGIRKFILSGLLIVSAGLILLLRKRGACRTVRAISGMLVLPVCAIGFIALLATGMIPAGINFDYARWMIWPFQMILVCAALLMVTAPGLPCRWARILCLGIFVLCNSWVSVKDSAAIQRFHASAQPVAASSLFGLSETLRGQKCVVIAETQPILGGLHHIGVERMTDFLDQVSACRVLGGSFTRPPVTGGLSPTGLPTPSQLEQLSAKGTTIYLLGGNGLLNTVASGISDNRLEFMGDVSVTASLYQVH